MGSLCCPGQGGPGLRGTVAGLPLSCVHSCLSSLVRSTAKLLCGAGLADHLPREPCLSQPHHQQGCLCLRHSRPALSVLWSWLKFGEGQPKAGECSKQHWFPIRGLREMVGLEAGGVPMLASIVFYRLIFFFWKRHSISSHPSIALVPPLILSFQSFLCNCFCIVVII